MSEVPTHEHTTPRGEWRKFSILVIILVGVIIVVALLRPFIFNRVVPAILGENLPPATVEPVDAVDESIEAGEATNENTTEEGSEEMSSETEEDSSTEASSSNEGSSEEAAGDASTEQAVEAESEEGEAASESEQQTHIVQSGENLLQIARQYGVSADDIIQANNISNPNVVRIGDELVIPSN
ncbi:MAG: LysM domain-containing protein [Chloroflexota bacterium]